MRRTITGAAIALVLAAATPAQAQARGLDWQPCPQPQAAEYHAQCANLGDLALMKIPATQRSQGPVLADSQEINGYGGSQLAFFLEHGDNYLARLPRTHATHDIVLFDPRGLGASEPVDCPQPAHDPAIPEFPRNPRDAERIILRDFSVYAHCLVATGPRLARDGLVEQAHDLDALRVALRVPELDFLGQATGAELGVVYAAEHPEHAGRIVLDTAVDPYLSNEQRVLDTAHAEETAFDRFVAWCTPDNVRCALAGKDVAKAYADLLAKGVPGLTDDEVRIAVGQFLVGYPMAWPGLAEAIATGDPADLQPFVQVSYPEPDYTGSRAQTCTDHPGDPTALVSLAKQVRAAAPHTGGTSFHWDALVSCAGWPSGPSLAERLPAHFAPASPVLITTTADDPINPVSWATELRGHIAGAHVLTSPVDGHGALDNAPCAAAAIDAYLAAGRIPESAQCRD